MLIDRFILPSRDDELDYYLSGGATLGMPSNYDASLPFGVFPRLGLRSFLFKDVTVLSGSSSTERFLLMRIMAAKLGVRDFSFGIGTRCLDDYLSRCFVGYSSSFGKDINCELITREEREIYFQKLYSRLDRKSNEDIIKLYASRICKENTLYFLEEPDNGMSVRETCELCLLIGDMVRYSGCQFIITSNSPIIASHKGSVIYDFDRKIVEGQTWEGSHYSKKIAKLWNIVLVSQSKKKTDKTKREKRFY